MSWLISELFGITEAEKKRISEIIRQLDELAVNPASKWQRTVNTNEDHLRMWLMTGKLDNDTPSQYASQYARNELPNLDMSDEKLFELWKAECEARKRITEIERCACTILMRTIGMIGDNASDSKDERVVRWIHRLCTHANWYWWGPRGVHSNGPSGKLRQFDYAEYYKGAEHVDRLVYYSHLVDDALLGLGGALASYRSDDRPDGDQSHRLDRMSEITVTSSLAAEVANFHAHMMYAKYAEYNDL